MIALGKSLARDAAPRGDRKPPLAGNTIRNNLEMEVAKDKQKAEDYSRWSKLVTRVRSGDETGMEELYQVFSKGIRFYLCRQLGTQDLDDKVHDTFLIVVEAIRRGDLREPERLMGFVRTVARRQVAAHIDDTVQRRRDADLEENLPVLDSRLSPEDRVISSQKLDLMKEVLLGISERDREILTRFYLHEQTQQQICEEMDLSETQFRLLKSRAKARFGEFGRKRLTSRPLSNLLMRFYGRERH